MKNAFENPTGQPNEQLLRKKETAVKLACSLRTVDRLANEGRLKRVPIRGGVRFRLSEVQLLMNGGTA